VRPLCHIVFLGACALCACDSSPPPFILTDGATQDASRDGSIDGAVLRDDAGPIRPPADRTVILAYGAPAVVIDYDVSTLPAQFDLHVSMDTTSSFSEEIDALQETLTEQILPSVRSSIARTSVGVSSFEDFPSDPFGGANDRPFTLETAITSNTSRVNSALARLDSPIGYGGDFPESGFEALYQIATGAGYKLGSETLIPRATGAALEGGGRIGGVGFRPGSLRAVLHITDARSHTPLDYQSAFPGTRGRAEAIAALQDERIRVIGIASGTIARDDLTAVALGTGAVMPTTNGACPTGVGGATYAPVEGVCPLVFDVYSDGTGLSATVLDAITRLVDSIRYESVAFDLGDDRLGFVVHARAVSATVSPGTPAPTRADVSPLDGVEESFLGVHVGTTLHYALTLANDILPELDYEQVFLLEIAIVADGTTLLEETIRVVVPARALPDPGIVDAGGGDVVID
jgi:hypothetical protein